MGGGQYGAAVPGVFLQNVGDDISRGFVDGVERLVK